VPIPIPSYDQQLTAGTKTSSAWYRFWVALAPSTAFTGTVTTAKLTVGGTNGALVFTNGILTKVTPAT
jgi:hypothetical protein